jgi:hypothetical protein
VKKRHPFELAAHRTAMKAKERLEMRDPESLAADRAAAKDKEEWDRQAAEWLEQEKLRREQTRELLRPTLQLHRPWKCLDFGYR